MELRQLRYFVATATTLNFSDAALKVNITQSTLSQQIKQLEDELGSRLFFRNKHSVRLTEEGERILPIAIDILASADSCKDMIQNLKELRTGTLTIGVTYSFSPIVTESVLEFTRQFPGVKLRIIYKTMEELMNLLLGREVDFVLAFKPDSINSMIETHELFDSHLAAIVNPEHPLAMKSTVTIEEIFLYPIALPSKGLQARNAFDRLVESRICPDPKIELNEVNILISLVKSSKMITVLSETSVYGNNDVKAVRIEHGNNRMCGCIHSLVGAYRKHSMQEFIKILSQSHGVMMRRFEWL